MLFKLNNIIESDIENGLILISSKNSRENEKISLLWIILGKDDKEIYKANLIILSNNTSYILYCDNKKSKKVNLIDIGFKKVTIVGIVDNENY